MKKLIALFLVVFVSASIVGCGGETKSTTTKAPAGGGTTEKSKM